MPMTTLKSHAKVNWHLAVGERRPDGYHPIASVFQRASLYDEVSVTVDGCGSATSVTGLEDYVKQGYSTVDKAIALWRDATSSNANVHVSIRKSISVQSGLGGGSSNAATVLLALDAMSKAKLPFEELCTIGLKVGCDVPFFLHQCDAACVYGIGEVVYPIDARHDLKGFLLVPNDEKVSTAQAYAALDGRRCVLELEPKEVLLSEYSKPVSDWGFRNDFELVNRGPNVEVLEGERLVLTGSGSCWILLTERSQLPPCDGCRAVPIHF